MVHVLPPMMHEEVIVPNTLHLSDEEKKSFESALNLKIENERIQKRLQVTTKQAKLLLKELTYFRRDWYGGAINQL